MQNSTVFAGLNTVDVGRFSDAVGGDPTGFFILIQRVAWGVTQPDLIRVDVPATLGQLESRYPDCPISHLMSAYALRESDDASAADALARARERCTPDHPFAHVMPTDDEWACRFEEPKLEEVASGRVHLVRYMISRRGAS